MTIYGVIPGHARSVHCLVSVLFPAQVFPPFCGGGSEQVRVRVVVPCPQDLLHAAQGDQAAQTPSTVRELEKEKF